LYGLNKRRPIGPQPSQTAFINLMALLTVFPEAKILAEKRHHIVLETNRHRAGMSALVYFKAVSDAVFIQHIVQLAGINT
jgi:hypothetical protein